MTSSISSLVRTWKIRHWGLECSYVWIKRVVYFSDKHPCLVYYQSCLPTSAYKSSQAIPCDILIVPFWFSYFTSEGKNKCFDLVTRKSYRVDEIWMRGDFACTACVCRRSGRLSCWTIQCNTPGCKNPARVEGRCCRFCSDTDWNKGLCYAIRVSRSQIPVLVLWLVNFMELISLQARFPRFSFARSLDFQRAFLLEIQPNSSSHWLDRYAAAVRVWGAHAYPAGAKTVLETRRGTVRHPCSCLVGMHSFLQSVRRDKQLYNLVFWVRTTKKYSSRHKPLLNRLVVYLSWQIGSLSANTRNLLSLSLQIQWKDVFPGWDRCITRP